MKRVRAGVVVLLLLLAVVALDRMSARPRQVPPATLSQQVAGLGSLDDVVQDQGNTVPLPDGRTLWIFADSAHLAGTPTFFVTSSAGVSRRGAVRLRYLTDTGGTPVEFLPRTPAERADQVIGEHYTAVWPTGATVLPDGRVIIAYAKYQVRMKPDVDFRFLGGGLYEYRYGGLSTLGAGATATRIADDIWTAADGPVASPVYAGGFVYFLRCEEFRCYSARTTPAGLADRATYTWWTGGTGGTGWSGLRAEARALTFGSDVPGRNPAVAHDPATGMFVMTDTSGGIQATEGRLWVAEDPWGPWSVAAPFPLPQCPATGCYTLNVHPLDSPAGTLRVSFATSGVGPYVRVVDVPVEITPGTPPEIRSTPEMVVIRAETSSGHDHFRGQPLVTGLGPGPWRSRPARGPGGGDRPS